MTDTERIEALEAEVQNLRIRLEQLAAMPKTEIHNHYHYAQQPSPTLSPAWQPPVTPWASPFIVQAAA